MRNALAALLAVAALAAGSAGGQPSGDAPGEGIEDAWTQRCRDFDPGTGARALANMTGEEAYCHGLFVGICHGLLATPGRGQGAIWQQRMTARCQEALASRGGGSASVPPPSGGAYGPGLPFASSAQVADVCRAAARGDPAALQALLPRTPIQMGAFCRTETLAACRDAARVNALAQGVPPNWIFPEAYWLCWRDAFSTYPPGWPVWARGYA